MNEIMHRLGDAYPARTAGTDIAINRSGTTLSAGQRALWLLLGTADWCCCSAARMSRT